MQHKLGICGACLGGQSSYQLVWALWQHPNTCRASTSKAQSNGIVITEAQSPVVSCEDLSRIIAVLVQSQRKGVNKVNLTAGVAIPASSKTIIEGAIQAKDISQAGMISASQSDNVKHLKGLHIACLVVTPVDKLVLVRIANTTANDIKLAKACKLA